MLDGKHEFRTSCFLRNPLPPPQSRIFSPHKYGSLSLSRSHNVNQQQPIISSHVVSMNAVNDEPCHADNDSFVPRHSCNLERPYRTEDKNCRAGTDVSLATVRPSRRLATCHSVTGYDTRNYRPTGKPTRTSTRRIYISSSLATWKEKVANDQVVVCGRTLQSCGYRNTHAGRNVELSNQAKQSSNTTYPQQTNSRLPR